MARRQRKGRCAKCSRSEALYIMNRMLMNSVARMISAAGVPCESSCAVATIDAPAKTKTDIAIAASGAMPLATIATPVMTQGDDAEEHRQRRPEPLGERGAVK